MPHSTLHRSGFLRPGARVYFARPMSWFPPDLRGHTPNRVHALRKAARFPHLKRSLCNRSAQVSRQASDGGRSEDVANTLGQRARGDWLAEEGQTRFDCPVWI